MVRYNNWSCVERLRRWVKDHESRLDLNLDDYDAFVDSAPTLLTTYEVTLFTGDNYLTYVTGVWDPWECVPKSDTPLHIKVSDRDGNVIYEHDKVDYPSTWTEQSVQITASKYFRVNPKTGERETSIYQMIERVVSHIAYKAIEHKYVQSVEGLNHLYNHLVQMLLEQRGAWNSPVWFNVGIEARPQVSACFILGVEDTLTDDKHSIMQNAVTEARIFKFGSGAGSNRSRLRSSKEMTSRGNYASGPMSFMKVYDVGAAVTKSGSTARRAAKMEILDISHPDIEEFIVSKREEEKVAHALIQQGYSSDFTDPNGAYSKAHFQNCNMSVRVPDEFMQAVDYNDDWLTRYVTSGDVHDTYAARDLLNLIAECAWQCGDPGIQFDSIINQMHTLPNEGRINGSNPCSEYMSLDNTACNLASLRLTAYWDETDTFDEMSYIQDLLVMSYSMDLLIEFSSYPTEVFAENVKQGRQLGIGYTDLGGLFLRMGIAYDSDLARSLCGRLTSILTGTTYLMSAIAATELGVSETMENNRFAVDEVLTTHAAHAETSNHAVALWHHLEKVRKGRTVRNSQATVLAPTGTISFLMGCTTTGIEPMLGLVQYKKLVGSRETIKITNPLVIEAVRSWIWEHSTRDEPGKYEELADYLDSINQIGCLPKSTPEDLVNLLMTSLPDAYDRSLSWQSHVNMMAAAQPYLSGAISKTVNMPQDSTVEDIKECYMMAWRAGLKAIAIYRDGSKMSQAVSTKSEEPDCDDPTSPDVEDGSPKWGELVRPSKTRVSMTHEFKIGGHKFFITVGLDRETNKPIEIFVNSSKVGSFLRSMMDSWAIAVSYALQAGVPVDRFIRVYEGTKCEPSGITDNSEIQIAQSPIDYIARWLYNTFSGRTVTATPVDTQPVEPTNELTSRPTGDPCPSCGNFTLERAGSCMVCRTCGETTGCG